MMPWWTTVYSQECNLWMFWQVEVREGAECTVVVFFWNRYQDVGTEGWWDARGEGRHVLLVGVYFLAFRAARAPSTSSSGWSGCHWAMGRRGLASMSDQCFRPAPVDLLPTQIDPPHIWFQRLWEGQFGLILKRCFLYVLTGGGVSKSLIFHDSRPSMMLFYWYWISRWTVGLINSATDERIRNPVGSYLHVNYISRRHLCNKDSNKTWKPFTFFLFYMNCSTSVETTWNPSQLCLFYCIDDMLICVCVYWR